MKMQKIREGINSSTILLEMSLEDVEVIKINIRHAN